MTARTADHRLRPPATTPRRVATVAPPDLPRLLAPQPDLAHHLDRLGALPVNGSELIRLAHEAGVAGRGGAGFPTARKLAAVAGARGRRVVVANGTEGEPLSAKDKTLLTRSPHLVLDGLDAAAEAVGASRRIVSIERGNPAVFASLRAALAERRDGGVEIVLTPRRYVSGQESALVDFLDGGPGRPTLSRPFERGVGGQPTLVDNVETLAHLALVARFGPQWYRGVGTPSDPGTALVTVSGAVAYPGVYEIPYGTPLAAVLDHAGADGAPATPAGVLIGGYFGRWLGGAAARGVTLDRDGLAAHGAGLGCGVIAVVGQGSCAVAELARVAEWYAGASAGQCGACTWGLRDLAAATGALDAGTPDPAAVGDIRRWAGMVRGRGACRLPDGAATFLESGIEVFAAEIDDHAAGHCGRDDRRLLPVPAQEVWR